MLELRWVGAVAIAIWVFLLGLFWIGGGILLTTGGGGILSFTVGLLDLLVGAVAIASAIGAIRRRVWGRKLLIFASAVIAVWLAEFLITKILERPETLEAEYLKSVLIPFSGTLLFITLVGFVYLLLPKTKQLFLKKTEARQNQRKTDIAL